MLTRPTKLAMRRGSIARHAWAIGMLLMGWVAACGSDGNGESDFGKRSTDPNAPGGGGPVGSFGGEDGSTGGGLLDDACAAEKQQSHASDLDLFIMMDKSRSMADDGKWAAATSAIKQFLTSSASSGIGVGIQYFPLIASQQQVQACAAQCTSCGCVANCGCPSCQCSTTNGVTRCSCSATADLSSCDVADYAAPDVEIEALPGAAAKISASLDRHTPQGGTPSKPALDGAMQHAKAYAASHPSHKVVVVLATDGDPNDCESTPANVAQIAAQGVGGSPKILTFVIGVGDELTALNQVAAAGGTQNAFIVSTGGNVNQQFLAALNKIRELSVDCEYAIPTPASGQVDFDRVNVQVSTNGGAPGILGQVKSKADCDPVKGGWYYDDPNHPTKIEICETTCKQLNNGIQTEIEVLFGCSTLHANPH